MQASGECIVCGEGRESNPADVERVNYARLQSRFICSSKDWFDCVMIIRRSSVPKKKGAKTILKVRGSQVRDCHPRTVGTDG